MLGAGDTAKDGIDTLALRGLQVIGEGRHWALDCIDGRS